MMPPDKEISTLKDKIKELENSLQGLQKDRSILQSLFNSIPDEVWFTDLNEKFVLANAASLREFNLVDPRQLSVKDLVESLEVFRPDMSPRPLEEAPPLRALKGEHVRGQEEVVRVPSSGDLRYRQVNAEPVKDEFGKVVGAVCVVRDITKNKKVEEALVSSLEQFEELFNNISSGVAIYAAKDNGEDFVFLNINKAGEFFSKVRREEIIGKSVLEVFPGVKELGLFAVFQQVWRTGQSQHQPVSLYQDQRIKEWVENYIYKLPSGEIVAVYEDVTERKLMEENLQKSKDYLNNIINTVADPVFVKDIQHKFILVNDAECVLTGHPRDEVIGKTDYDFFPKEQVDVFWAKDEELLRTGQENINEEEITDAAGIKKTIVTKKTLYTDAAGNKFIVGIIRDITGRKNMENALKLSESLLNEVGTIAKVGGWEMDLATGKANWTKATYDIVEIEYDQPIPGLHEHVAYYLPEYREMISEKMRNLIATKQPMSFEAQAKTAKGNIKWFRAVGEAVEVDGKVVKLRGILQDISERKAAEQANIKYLKELEIFYKASVGREERILELKKEVERLKKELG